MSEKKELDVIEPAPVTPMALLQSAQKSGASIEQMQQLMELQFKWEANEARKAYNAAIAAFKAEGVKIVKDAHVKFSTSKGVTEYRHATIGNVVQKITVALSKYGLSHTWTVNQDQTGIEVTCKLSHAMGHFETAKIKAEADDSGGKNKIQQIGSTITYLERYTLLAITGLATHDQDDDGWHSGQPKEQAEKKGKPEVKQPGRKSKGGTITEGQISVLRKRLGNAGVSEMELARHFKVDCLENLPADQINEALALVKTWSNPS